MKKHKLPEFAAPPVTEVVLGVQFEPIELIPAQLGLWALRMRELGYSVFEQHPPLDPVVERFGKGVNSPQFKLDFGPPAVRSWFVRPDQDRLIQLQPDRFVHNWRKTGSRAEYPRYESIREEFQQRWSDFAEFFSADPDAKPALSQVEVTYVNAIPAESVGDLSNLLGLASNTFSDGFLPEIESTRLNATFVIPVDGRPVGRLHVDAHTAYDTQRKMPIYILKLFARGAPLSPDFDGALRFMDLGREWIVRGFADVTTTRMHDKWQREC